MNDVKKAFKNFDVRSKVTWGVLLGALLLVIDSTGFYDGQPLPAIVMRAGQVIALLLVTFGLVDVANLEKQNIIDKIKGAVATAPVIGTLIELVNLILNSLPSLADMIPAGAYNALHGLAAALIALGLRQQMGSARINTKPVSAELLSQAKYKVFKS